MGTISSGVVIVQQIEMIEGGGVLFCQVWQFNVADSPSNGQ